LLVGDINNKLGLFFWEPPINKPSNCKNPTNTLCELPTHTLTVYSNIDNSISDSCSFILKLKPLQVFLPNSSTNLTVDKFSCEIGTKFSFDFSQLITENSVIKFSKITYKIKTSVSNIDFSKDELLIDQNGVFTWNCRDITTDINSLYMSLETPDITIIATFDNLLPAYLLTFNILPYRRPIVKFNLNQCFDSQLSAGKFIANIDYSCQLEIFKCTLVDNTSQNCNLNGNKYKMKYLKNIKITITNISKDSNFLYKTDDKTGYFTFTYLYSGADSVDYINVSLQIFVEETLNFVNSNKIIKSEIFNADVQFLKSEIPKLINSNNNSSINVYLKSQFYTISNPTFYNVNTYFGDNLNISFSNNANPSNGVNISFNNYVYIFANFAKLNLIDVINKPADMFIIEEVINTYYRLSYVSFSYSNIDLQIALKRDSGITAYLFLRIITYFRFDINTPSNLITYLDTPFIYNFTPKAQVNGSQTIRLKDISMTLVSQKICLTITPQNCQNSNVIYKIDLETLSFMFYPDSKNALGNYCKNIFYK